MASDTISNPERSLGHDQGDSVGMDREWLSRFQPSHVDFIDPLSIPDPMIFRVSRVLERWGERSLMQKRLGMVIAILGFTLVCAIFGWGIWER
jgi:hypothetical protein